MHVLLYFDRARRWFGESVDLIKSVGDDFHSSTGASIISKVEYIGRDIILANRMAGTGTVASGRE
jgi:hypothetical protein